MRTSRWLAWGLARLRTNLTEINNQKGQARILRDTIAKEKDLRSSSRRELIEEIVICLSLRTCKASAVLDGCVVGDFKVRQLRPSSRAPFQRRRAILFQIQPSLARTERACRGLLTEGSPVEEKTHFRVVEQPHVKIVLSGCQLQFDDVSYAEKHTLVC